MIMKTGLGHARSGWALLLFAMVGSLAPRTRAQPCGANAQSPIATDRPQITASSIVVPCGSLQFENGFEETGTGGQRGFVLVFRTTFKMPTLHLVLPPAWATSA